MKRESCYHNVSHCKEAKKLNFQSTIFPNAKGNMNRKILVQVISDFACPWCYVGAKRLWKAIEKQEADSIQVDWLPYQLNPDMPPEGMNRREYYRNKFGETTAKSLRDALAQAAAPDGITFCDEPDAIAPNTLSAHVLMHWTRLNSDTNTDRLAEKIFYAHHTACKNIGDDQVLEQIIKEMGMNPSEVMSEIQQDKYRDLVSEQIQSARMQGINGVPLFILDQTIALSGAQPAQKFVSSFVQILNSDEKSSIKKEES
jgi:predicted DsbA family dithiol-disulfide isomerase